MIQHHFRHELQQDFSILNDREFLETQHALDGQMKKSARLGYVQKKKKAKVINREDEVALWEMQCFGSENPKQLIMTLIYHLGLHLSLRAAQEHYDLEFGESHCDCDLMDRIYFHFIISVGSNSQLKLHKDEEGEFLEYTERFSKNHQFGLRCTRMEPKSTRVYANKGNKDRCIVEIYKRYISHRPETHGKKG